MCFYQTMGITVNILRVILDRIKAPDVDNVGPEILNVAESCLQQEWGKDPNHQSKGIGYFFKYPFTL